MNVDNDERECDSDDAIAEAIDARAFDPGVGRMSSINRVIRCKWGTGFTGCPAKAALPVCCSTEARSPVGSNSFSVSIVTYSACRSYYLSLFACIRRYKSSTTRIPILKAYLFQVKNTSLK